jgi:hypothetical protein
MAFLVVKTSELNLAPADNALASIDLDHHTIGRRDLCKPPLESFAPPHQAAIIGSWRLSLL